MTTFQYQNCNNYDKEKSVFISRCDMLFMNVSNMNEDTIYKLGFSQVNYFVCLTMQHKLFSKIVYQNAF